jgi:hypothetical protein
MGRQDPMTNDQSVILDPRGRQERPMLKLAKRPTLAGLKKGPVLFYNNTKLDFCNYDEVFSRIKERFAEKGVRRFVDFKETVRGKTTQGLRDYAAKIARARPVAAVVALGDMGTTPATTVLAIALEELGIPTVYITASPGAELAQAVAFYRAGQLCLCPIDIYQGSTRAEVAAEIDKQIGFILDALTLPPGKIEKCARIDFALDREPPAETLPFTPEGCCGEPGGDMEAVMDLFDRLHLGDGLPIIPPTPRRLRAMLAYAAMKPDAVLAREIGPTGKDITVRDVAVGAIMAGCKPNALPILVSAFQAMGDPRYNFLQSVTTSHPGGNLVLVSGPLAQEAGLYGGPGCLGPGFAANATIGRAVNLVIINVCRSVPGVSDLDCLASQAEFTYCFAEDPHLSPWPTINAERFDKKTTSVYVLKAEPPHDIIDFLSQTAGDLLDTIVDCATTLGSNNAYIPGNLVLVITPDHAKLLAREGWTKDKIRRAIHERAHHEAPMVRNRGLVPVRPADFTDRHPVPVTRGPEDVEIVVAGNRGGHSAIILPWALHSEAIVRPVLLSGGKVPRSLDDFAEV